MYLHKIYCIGKYIIASVYYCVVQIAELPHMLLFNICINIFPADSVHNDLCKQCASTRGKRPMNLPEAKNNVFEGCACDAPPARYVLVYTGTQHTQLSRLESHCAVEGL